MAKLGQKKLYYRDLESFKIFLKKVAKKSVLLYFWSRSVGIYDFRVDRLWYKSCLGGQIILYLQMPYARTGQFFLKFFKLFRSLYAIEYYA